MRYFISFIFFKVRQVGPTQGGLGSSSVIEPPEIIIIVRFEWKESICFFFPPFFCLLRALRGGKNVEEIQRRDVREDGRLKMAGSR